MTTRWARTTVTMSDDFIRHIYRLFFDSLATAAKSTSGYSRQGHNLYAPGAAPAYLAAVAAVEAFINEYFLSGSAFVESPITVVRPEWLEQMEVTVKVILVPQLALGRTLPRNRQPYQDFVLLTKVRNELVHYKMGWAPKFVRALADRGIALRVEPEAEEARGGIAWAHRLTTTEGIRWAHNTAVEMVRALAGLFPDGSAVRRISDSWSLITDAMLAIKLRELGIEA